MRRIIGVVVCGAHAFRNGAREVYIYELADEGCPRGSQFGSPDCERRIIRTLDHPVAGASDYTNALAHVVLPADTEGLAALEAARPGAIFEVAGQRDASGPGRGVGEEVEFLEGAVVTPLPGPAPREALRALEIPAPRIRDLPGGVPAVVRGVAAAPVQESGSRAAAAWFLLEFQSRRQSALPVILFGRRADELPTIAPGVEARVACVRRELIDPLDERLPPGAREALFPGRPLADLPYSIEVLFGGPESAVMLL